MVSTKTLEYDVLGTSTAEKISSTSILLDIAEDNANYIVHRALNAQKQNSRQGTISTKTRSEVSGGGRKPWKQKGTVEHVPDLTDLLFCQVVVLFLVLNPAQ